MTILKAATQHSSDSPLLSSESELLDSLQKCLDIQINVNVTVTAAEKSLF